MARLLEYTKFNPRSGFALPVPFAIPVWKQIRAGSFAFSRASKCGQGIEHRAVLKAGASSASLAPCEGNGLIVVSVQGENGHLGRGVRTGLGDEARPHHGNGPDRGTGVAGD